MDFALDTCLSCQKVASTTEQACFDSGSEDRLMRKAVHRGLCKVERRRVPRRVKRAWRAFVKVQTFTYPRNFEELKQALKYPHGSIFPLEFCGYLKF